MTAKREAELETENRMLREQVADLKAVIEQISRPPQVPYYWPYTTGWASGGGFTWTSNTDGTSGIHPV